MPLTVLQTGSTSDAAPKTITLTRPSIDAAEVSVVGVTLAGTDYTSVAVQGTLDGTNWGTALDTFGAEITVTNTVEAIAQHRYVRGDYVGMRLNLPAGGGVTSTATLAWVVQRR